MIDLSSKDRISDTELNMLIGDLEAWKPSQLSITQKWQLVALRELRDLRTADEPPAVDVAPIAKLTVRDGLVQRAGLYAPGLPDGDHDVFPVPLSPKGELRPHVLAEPPEVARLQSLIAKALQHLECEVPEWYEGMQLLRSAVTKSEIPAAAQSAANSGQCESRKAAQSGTAAGASVETREGQS